MPDLSASPATNIPIVGPLLELIQQLKPPMTQFKDSLDTMLGGLGVDDETRKRLRDVFDLGDDSEMTQKLDELVRGTLIGKDGAPIELKNAEGEPIELDRETISKLAEQYKIKSNKIDVSQIGPQEWEKNEEKDEPGTLAPVVNTQWMRG